MVTGHTSYQDHNALGQYMCMKFLSETFLIKMETNTKEWVSQDIQIYPFTDYSNID
jgi:hypothetical protein